LILISIALENFWLAKIFVMPDAQKVYRLLRYAFTGILAAIESLAQRGPDEAAERPPKGVGWLA